MGDKIAAKCIHAVSLFFLSAWSTINVLGYRSWAVECLGDNGMIEILLLAALAELAAIGHWQRRKG